MYVVALHDRRRMNIIWLPNVGCGRKCCRFCFGNECSAPHSRWKSQYGAVFRIQTASRHPKQSRARFEINVRCFFLVRNETRRRTGGTHTMFVRSLASIRRQLHRVAVDWGWVEYTPSRDEARQQLAQTNFVVGPVRMVELVSSRYNKRIYLCGDKHVMASRCPPEAQRKRDIDRFLADLVSSVAPLVVDLWFEYPYRKHPITETVPPSYLAETEYAFSSCLQRDKTKCKLKNARVHYVDIRELEVPEMRALYGLREAVQDFYSLSSPSSHQVHRTLKQVLENRWVLDRPVDNEKWLTALKIRKQWKSIPEEFVRKRLEETIQSGLSYFRPSSKELDHILPFIQSRRALTRTEKAYLLAFIRKCLVRTLTCVSPVESSHLS